MVRRNILIGRQFYEFFALPTATAAAYDTPAY
jgi:hypothetical protein